MTVRHLVIALALDAKDRPVLWKIEPPRLEEELTGLSAQRTLTAGLDFVAERGWELVSVDALPSEWNKKFRTTRATFRRTD